MKNYRQLVKELPSKTVVFVFGRFNPPTTGHELLFKMVKKIATQNNADHIIYASRTQDKKKNPLPIDRKLHYLKLMFKGFNFVAANENERTFIEAATHLNKKYKNIIMVAGSDRVTEYERLLNRYNGKNFKFDTIQVVSAGERDPDSDNAAGMSASKMRQSAEKGNFIQFKRGLPNSVREIDARLLMNEIRQAMGLDAIKEEVRFSVDRLREKYFKGEIYHIGDIVESAGQQFEILDRGTNYVTVVDDSGKLSRKWIRDIKVIGSLVKEDIQPGYAPKEITFKGYTTKNLHHSGDATKAFAKTLERLNDGEIKDPVAVLNALKATDAYMKLNDMHLEQGKAPDEKEVQDWIAAHEKAKESLEKIGEFPHHFDYWNTHKTELQLMSSNFKETGKGEFNEELTKKTIRSADKIKVARIIADMLGVEKAENMSSPSQLINMGMRKVKTKVMRPEMLNVLSKMLKLADELDIKYDKNALPAKLRESVTIDTKSDYNGAKDILRYADYLKLNKLNKLGKGKNVKMQQDLDVSEVGSTLAKDDHLRRKKVKYKTEEVEIDEDAGTANYKLSKSGRKVPAKVLHDKDAKKVAKDDENKRELNRQKKDLEAARKGEPIEEASDPYHDEMDCWDADGKKVECKDIPEKEVDDIVNSLTDDDLLDAYDEDELHIVDDETGEHVADLDDTEEGVNEEALNEVLSRAERIKAKIRFMRTKAKRSRLLKIALKRRSGVKVVNRRARRLAVKLLKKRLAKKPLNKLSVGEKERIERILKKRKELIKRIGMKLVPRIRKVETSRLQHKAAGGQAQVGGF